MRCSFSTSFPTSIRTSRNSSTASNNTSCSRTIAWKTRDDPPKRDTAHLSRSRQVLAGLNCEGVAQRFPRPKLHPPVAPDEQIASRLRRLAHYPIRFHRQRLPMRKMQEDAVFASLDALDGDQGLFAAHGVPALAEHLAEVHKRDFRQNAGRSMSNAPARLSFRELGSVPIIPVF